MFDSHQTGTREPKLHSPDRFQDGGYALMAAAADSDGVVRWLATGAFAGIGPGETTCIETHASVVVLGGDTAIKVKKAVDLGYLDFSTLEKRRAAILREFEINHPNAPQIYLDARAIRETPDGGLTLAPDAEGGIVEWALVMRRFPQDALLGRCLDDLRIAGARRADGFWRALAQVIADAHARAKIDTKVSSRAEMDGLLGSLHARLEAASETDDVRRRARDVLARADRLLGTVGALLDRRARAGYVRRCHGDMHLANVVVLDGAPVLFDAIEFDERIATVDVLNDLAFLLMDLVHHGATREANTVLNAYLSLTWGDSTPLDGLAALPLFLTCRAMIRALVALDRARQGNSGGSTARAARARADAYLATAIFMSAPTRPRLIAVGGRSGTGKTTLARGLAPRIGPVPGAVVLRSDVFRKRMFDVGETERLPEDAYAPEVSEQVYLNLFDDASRIVTAGYSAIVDAAFLEAKHRDMVEAIAEKIDCPFDGVWLEGRFDVLADRIAGRRDDASDATIDVLSRQMEVETGVFGPAWHCVDAARQADAVLADAAGALGATRCEGTGGT